MTTRSPGDGRNIDARIGELSGEAAEQAVPADRAASDGIAHEVWRGQPPDANSPTYYERPVIKQPVWIWTVPAYFYAGGAAGAASVLGAASQRRGLHRLARQCRVVGLLGVAASSALLVRDLGRPGRFHHMLRVFRPTSPMSMGSWFLAGYGPAAGAAVVLPGELAEVAGAAAGILGLPVAAYTGVLLGNTAVPVWLATRRVMPLLFCATAVTSAASLLDLVPHDGTESEVVRRYAITGKVAELALGVAMDREAGRVPEVGRPLHTGRSGALWRISKVLTAASLGCSLVSRRSRRMRVAAGVLGTGGALVTRVAIVSAGRASAADPRATFRQQRA